MRVGAGSGDDDTSSDLAAPYAGMGTDWREFRARLVQQARRTRVLMAGSRPDGRLALSPRVRVRHAWQRSRGGRMARMLSTLRPSPSSVTAAQAPRSARAGARQRRSG